MIDAGLKGTDYVLRSYALVFSDLGRVALSATLWVMPVAALYVWVTFGPGGLTDPETVRKTQQMMLEVQRSGAPAPFDWYALLWSILYACLELVLLAGFAIQQHRDVLVRVMPMTRGLAASLPPFVGYWLLFMLLLQILPFVGVFVLTGIVNASPYYIPAWLSFLMAVSIFVAFAFLAFRSALIFPAIAVGDQGMTLRRSFDLTSRCVWRMILSFILIAVPLALASMTFAMAMGHWIAPRMIEAANAGAIRDVWPWMMTVQAVNWVFIYFGTALFVTYISLVFARLRGGPVPTPPDWDEADSTSPK